MRHIIGGTLVAALLTAGGGGERAYADRPRAGRADADRAGSRAADVESAYDREQRELARQALREGRRAEGILPLLELFGRFDRVDPEVTRAELERLRESRRLSPDRRAYVGALLARTQLRMGDPAASDETIDALGYVTSWRVLGPFDDQGKSGFDEELPPEAMRLDPVDLERTFSGKERPVSWRPWPGLTRYGYVALDTVLRPTKEVCGYAETFVHSDRAQPLSLWVGAGGASAMWWNGEEVHRDPTYRAEPDPDRQVAMVGARNGANRLLVKVCSTGGTFGFFLRLGNERGGPASGLRVEAGDADSPVVPPGHAEVRLPDAPEPPLAALERAAAAASPSARALEHLARFLAATGADDPAEHRARQLAARAAEREPTVERLTLAASLAEHRGEIMKLAARAEEVAGDDPRTRLLQAKVIRGGLTPEDALPVLRKLDPNRVVGLDALLLRGQLLRAFELPESSLAVLAEAKAAAPKAAVVHRELAESAQSAGRADALIAHREAAVALRYDDIGSRRVLLADAIERQTEEGAEAQLTALETLATTTGEYRYLARQREALGDDAKALELLHRGRDLAPHDASMLVAEGRLLLRMGQPEAAASALWAALNLRPQDAETRELLEQLGPKRERRDERYAVAQKELLARRVEGSGYPITVLQDLTVNTVYENGLGSSFHQIAVQIQDEEGARAWRTFSTQYDPNSQRLRVRSARVYRQGRVLEATQSFERPLGEPWYRIYYDTRAHVVVLPTLEPGDVVELRYRVDDVAHRNIFADYFGDLTFLQRFAPVKRQDYILLTPKKRTFYFNEPELAGLRHERSSEGDTRIDHFFAEDVPPLVQEPKMPGMTEVAPYLHVSTYETWQQVGRWYWGLIQDQLYADESLKETVRELVQDAPDVRTKVKRIHRWVLDHTRYVALEFGIHGFKPYRVPQVVRRGFGDCKDKASLLYTMFREAGVDAHIVLVRTRRNGAITDLPASLAVFDHAIAYVPDLDLYIDGTAEHSGLTELPPQDQGVTVLHVSPSGSELRRTPVLPPKENLRTRELIVDLERSGAAELEVKEEVHGAGAASYRSTFSAEGTRQERFERAVRRQFPGLVLHDITFPEIDDRNEPVRVSYSARVPQLAQDGGGTLRVEPAVPSDLLGDLAPTASRTHPLDLGRTRLYRERRVLRLPPGTQLARSPEGGTAKSPFGTVSVEVERTDGAVEARTEVRITADRVAPDDYERFRRFVEEADLLLRQRFTIQTEGP